MHAIPADSAISFHLYPIPQLEANLRATRDIIINDAEQRTDDASLTLLEIKISWPWTNYTVLSE